MRQHGLTRNGELIILQRFHGGIRSSPGAPDEPLRRLLVVDVETTGLTPGRDPIIEFAAARVDVSSPEGVVREHLRTVSWLEDPGRPIPPEITTLTGLRDEDVAGRRIPDDEVRGLFQDCDLIVAHNARFDRAMCLVRFPWLAAETAPVWGCSLQQIDWRGYGHRHADLGSLARDHGFFYDAHRASIDVEALVKLLAMRPEGPGAPVYLSELMADALRPYWAVAASGTPYDARDDLRGRGYRWDPDAKHWHGRVPDEALEAELAWLAELCERFGSGHPLLAELPFRHRFDDAWVPRWEAR